MKPAQSLVDYCKSKIGTPYFYGAKMQVLTEPYMAMMHDLYPSTVTKAYMTLARLKGMVGKECTDCSGLIGAFRKRQIGSAQLYATAKARLEVADYQKWANGVVAYRQGHVGTFYQENGKFYVVEAKGINYGTVLSTFNPKKWEKGLTFDDLTYVYAETAEHTGRATNPYMEPVNNLKKGDKGEGVKWIQFELREAGFAKEIDKAGGIDGDFGKATEKAVKEFQKSCKITADGIVGKMTRAYLKGV